MTTEDVTTTEDVLGAGYQVRTIPLPPDEEGEVVATLVRRQAPDPNGAAVLYVHGFSDYFFQTELADFHTARGTDFYALDLRKYGRSLRDHQSPGYILDIRDYFPELTEATRIIREEHGHRQLVVNAHSTGGLITALWAHSVRDQGLVDGLVLNSPWLDMQGGWAMRHPMTAAVKVLGRVRPKARIRGAGTGLYGYSIHRDHHGEWEFDLRLKPIEGFPIFAGFDLRLKPIEGFPIFAGWLRAIRQAHGWVHQGLAVSCPVLVMCSTGSLFQGTWHDDALRMDTVLDCEQIARWTPNLGPHTTLIRIEGGMHDLVLSAKPVRERVYAETARWLDAYVPLRHD